MRGIILALMAVFALSVGGCAGGSPHPPSSSTSTNTSQQGPEATAIAQRWGLHLEGPSTSSQATLPANIDASAQWGVVEIACLNGGYDLRPYAGRLVTLTKRRIVELHGGQPVNLVVVEQGAKVVGAYAVVDSGTPGVYGLKEAAVKR